MAFLGCSCVTRGSGITLGLVCHSEGFSGSRVECLRGRVGGKGGW